MKNHQKVGQEVKCDEFRYNVLGNKNTEIVVSEGKKMNFLVFSLCELTEEVDIREVDITIGKNI
jgi:hypothetical protein